MPNLATVLKEEIRRLARKEAKVQVAALKKASAQQRRDIAALKRLLAEQLRVSARLAKAASGGRALAPAPDASPAHRFSPTWLRKHRTKLGLSAADYARLVGVSGLSIYNWEGGKNKPRAAQVAALASVRGLSKSEVLERIGGKTPRGRKARSKKA